MAEAMTTLLMRSRAVICSPSLRKIWDPPMEAARAEAVTVSSQWRVPASMHSMTNRRVMILVTDAGGMASAGLWA